MRNKIFVRFLASLLICAILCCFSSCGKGLFAEEHEFLYEKMNEIPVEYEGYYLENCRSSSDENVFTGKEHAEYVFRDKSLTVNEENTVIDGRSFMCYAITYEEKEILIDSNFMQERSAT